RRNDEGSGARGMDPPTQQAAAIVPRSRPQQMIRLSRVTLRRGATTLLEGADIALNAGDKIGLIGANGSGKSSLFALLRGELHADSGEVDYPGSWSGPHVARETPERERPA